MDQSRDLSATQVASAFGGMLGVTSSTSAGVSIRDERPDYFVAELTGEASGAYSWKRKCSVDGGSQSDDGWAMAGTTTDLPAYAIDGATGLAAGTNVLMWPADGSQKEMRFIYPATGGGGGTTITFKDDKGGSVASSTHKVINSTVTSSGGFAVTTIDDASGTAPGIMNLTDQYFGGGYAKGCTTFSANEFRIYSGIGGTSGSITGTEWAKWETTIYSGLTTPVQLSNGYGAGGYLIFGYDATLTKNVLVANVQYTPLSSGDWSGDPATVADALDRLASAVAGLLGGPIP